ncbi:MAG: tetratricopeptide repeat protein, partial [Phycisphaerales bacterium]|nr:tetratricopeptide repeat protein [Phycisphaerales bacterium]
DAPSAASLNPALRGDLDAILHRAMERDPRRRYGSATELAEDLRRHLGDEPVIARPPSARDQLLKLARRHRPWVIGLSVAAIALVGGTGLATYFAIQSAQDAERARIQGRRAQAISRFQSDMFSAADPYLAEGEELTLREVLDNAAQELDGGALAEEPAVQASVRMTIGETYLHLGLLRQARRQLETTVELLEQSGDSDELVTALNLLADTSRDRDPASVAWQLEQNERALEIATRLHEPPHASIARSLSDMSITLSWDKRYDEAEEAADKAIRQYRALGPEYADQVARCLSSFGATLTECGRYDEAEETLREAVELRRRQRSENSPELAITLQNLAGLLDARGRFDEAESLYAEAIEAQRASLPPNHPDLAISLHNLASLRQKLGRAAEAVALFREAIAIREHNFGPDHADVATGLLGLAMALTSEADAGSVQTDEVAIEALAAETRALSILRKQFPGGHPFLAATLHNLAASAQKRGEVAEAEARLRESLAMMIAIWDENHPNVAHCRDTLAANLLLQGREAEAVPLLEAALRTREALLDSDHPQIGLTLAKLATARVSIGDADAAREDAERALALLKPRPGLEPDYAVCQLTMLEAIAASGDVDLDIDMQTWDEARATLADYAGEISWQLAEAQRVRALLLGANSPDAVTALAEADRILGASTAPEALTRRTAARIADTRAILGLPAR